MARKPNFNFQKRQKELDRQKKKAEKEDRKRQKKESGEPDDSLILAADDPDLEALGILPQHRQEVEVDDDSADGDATGRGQ
jgi:hypothetical protein